MKRLVQWLGLMKNQPGELSSPSGSTKATQTGHSRPREISAGELKSLLSDPTPPQLIDVREPFELKASGWIPGCIPIPMNNVPLRLSDLDPRRPTVVYCARGMRSYNVAALLLDQGFEDVASLEGGFASWKGPVETRS